MTAIKCCKGCVAPKRHTACWGHCPEYLAEKAQYDSMREAERKRNKTQADIINARTKAVTKALKNRRYSQKNYRRGSKSAQ